MRTTFVAVSILSLLMTAMPSCDNGGSFNAGSGGSGPGGKSVGGSGGETSAGGIGETAGAVATAGAKAVETVAATVAISGATRVPVGERFFGQNYWSWVPDWGDPVAGVQSQVETARIGILRAGGANNDKQDPAPFSLQEIDQFVAFAKAIGAAPLLQVPLLNSLSGARATAQDAADLVAYVNVTQGYAVPYFSIGNEPDLYAEQGAMDAAYDAAAYCSTFREFALAMKAVDPSIQIFGPELSWKYQTGSNDWLTPFLQGCGDVVDIISIHRYPIEPAACSESAAYADAPKYRAAIGHVRDLMAAAGQAEKPLAITEANITWDGEPAKSTMAASPGTFPAGLWVADSLGVALEAGLHSISHWSLSEGWTLGFFSEALPRPAFHVLKLFSTKFGTEALKVSGVPSGISVYAGRRVSDGNTTLFVVNKSNKELALSVTLTELPRAECPPFNVAPISLLVVELPDDGAAPVLTAYRADMTSPMPELAP